MLHKLFLRFFSKPKEKTLIVETNKNPTDPLQPDLESKSLRFELRKFCSPNFNTVAVPDLQIHLVLVKTEATKITYTVYLRNVGLFIGPKGKNINKVISLLKNALHKEVNINTIPFDPFIN